MTSFSVKLMSVRRRYIRPRSALSDLRLSLYMLLAALTLAGILAIVDHGLRV
jgi:hypothetical protein